MSRTRRPPASRALRTLAPEDLVAVSGGAPETYELGRMIIGTGIGIIVIASVKGALDHLLK